MRAVLRVEAIGWGTAHGRGRARSAVDAVLARQKAKRRMPWVAEITGFSARFGYRREFLDEGIDYDQASSSGERGVYYVYLLREGVYYEARRPVSWTRVERVFVKTENGAVVEVEREEVDQWLQERCNVARVSANGA